jgi:peptide deformylase
MEHFDGWLSDVVDEMFELMRKHNGIGLAAPQVGITQQLFVAEIDGRSLCLINPSIGSSSGYDQMVEGCLSLPGVLVDMERGGLIDVTGYDSVGQRRQELLQGLWARVVQHEIDHLDGVLIRDYVEPYQNKTLKRETTRARTR